MLYLGEVETLVEELETMMKQRNEVDVYKWK